MSLRRRLLMQDYSLPQAYTELNFISFDGNGYCLTDYLIKSDDRVEYRSRASKLVDNGLFGVNSTAGESFYIFYDGRNVVAAHGETSATSSNCIVYTPRDFIYQNSMLYEAGNNKITAFSTAAFKSKQPMYIGAINNGGTPDYPFNGMVYYFRIYNNSGKLLRSYVPCTRNSDGKAGLFELVYQKFCPILPL